MSAREERSGGLLSCCRPPPAVGIACQRAYFEISAEQLHPKAVALLANKDIDLVRARAARPVFLPLPGGVTLRVQVINIPSSQKADARDEQINCFFVRRAAVDYSVPLVRGAVAIPLGRGGPD